MNGRRERKGKMKQEKGGRNGKGAMAGVGLMIGGGYRRIDVDGW